MSITVSAFAWVPPQIQGLVRDLRVRWALEEAGLAYDERLVRLGDNMAAPYRDWQPFGQVPAYEEGEVRLFESGAIVLHIAERCPALLPTDEPARSRAKTWIFAALNTVEPPLMFLNWLSFNDTPEARAIAAPTTDWAKRQLGSLADWLGERDWLEDDFTAGDLMMASVLRIPPGRDLVAPALARYRGRCEARPAFRRALDAQIAAYKANAPPAD